MLTRAVAKDLTEEVAQVLDANAARAVRHVMNAARMAIAVTMEGKQVMIGELIDVGGVVVIYK